MKKRKISGKSWTTKDLKKINIRKILSQEKNVKKKYQENPEPIREYEKNNIEDSPEPKRIFRK